MFVMNSLGVPEDIEPTAGEGFVLSTVHSTGEQWKTSGYTPCRRCRNLVEFEYL